MRISIALVLLTLSGCSGDPVPDTDEVFDYVYRSFPISGNYGELRISRSNTLVAMGDLSGRLRDCSTEALKFCVTGDLFTFALPRVSMSDQQEWKHGHTTFVFNGISEESILGQILRVSTVTAKSADSEARFYYSELRGLVAIGSGPGNTTFINIDKCGLWASPDCR